LSSKARKIVLIVIILISAFAIVWFAFLRNSLSTANKDVPITYKTAPVQKSNISTSISIIGTLESFYRAEVKSEIDGKITEIYVDSGDRVTKDQPLLQLDTRDLNINLQKSEAQLITAQAELDKLLSQPTEFDLKQAEASYQEALIALEDARRTLDRHRELFTSGGLSQEQLEQSQDQVILKEQAVNVAKARLDDLKQQPKKEDIDIKRAQVSEAEANITSIKNKLDASLIKSPFTGTLIDVKVKVGDMIQPGTTTVIIDDMSTMKVVVPVNEVDVSHIQKGMKAKVVLDALPDKTFEGQVDTLSYLGKITENVVTYDATILIPNPEGLLRPEMTADVDITTQSKQNAVTIPIDALIEKNGKTFVLIAGKDTEPVEKEVKVGIRNDTTVEIIEGVKEGDRIAFPSSMGKGSLPSMNQNQIRVPMPVGGGGGGR